jgi:glycosyltransferase involved in cell wall biosynthesis
MTSPAVSVLMTAYNRERYIADSIDSVLAQSFDDFELVIVDDASRDATVEIARRYARRDPRVRVEVNTRHRGDYPNRNHAASLARGAFLKFHDSDDLMYPHCLAAMVPPMLAHPEAAFGLSPAHYWPGAPCPMLLTPRMSYQREFLGSGMFNAGPAGAIFRTEAFRALGGFVDRGAPSDYVFWLRACARVSVVLLPADLFWYRIHDGQELTSAKASREYARTIGDTWAALTTAECPLTDAEREQARRNVLARHARTIVRDLRRGRVGIVRSRIASGPGLHAWLRYLRLPRREMFAGTPACANGEFVAMAAPGGAAAANVERALRP